MSERDEVQGARNTETEIVRGVQRGCEYRATQQFARAATHEVFPKLKSLNVYGGLDGVMNDMVKLTDRSKIN